MATQLTKKEEQALDVLFATFDETLKEAPSGFQEDVLDSFVLKGKILNFIEIKFVKEKSCTITIRTPKKEKTWWINTRVELNLEGQQLLSAKEVTIALVEGTYRKEDYRKCVIYTVA